MKKKLSFIFVNIVFLLVGWFASQIFNSQGPSVSTTSGSTDIVNSSTDDSSYLTALENLLSDYEGKLASLLDINDVLKSKLDFYNNQKTITSVLPSFRKKIHHMSEEDIKENVESLVRHKHQLKDVEDYKSFALRFMDLALEEDELPENITDADYLTDVRISISKSSSQYIDVSDDKFQMSKYYKLFANISSSPPLKSVMLKWKNLNNGELIKYEVIGTATENDVVYVWARPKSGWEVGTYQVSIHKMNDSMDLIARRLYQISSVIDEGPEPTYDGTTLQRGD